MIGVCKRLSLVLVLILGMMSPVYAALSGATVKPNRLTANSISNLSVVWTDSNNKLPDAEVWMTSEINGESFRSSSPWNRYYSYYSLQPDPDATITETYNAVDVVESVYIELDNDGNINLPESVVGIKGIWLDRWHRENMWPGGPFTGNRITRDDVLLPSSVKHVFVSYYKPGTKLIKVDKSPLPCIYTLYKYPVEAGWGEIVINPEILRLDPDTAGLRTGGDEWYNLIGVYDNESLKGRNYAAGRVFDESTGTITLDTTISEGVRNLYVVVSTYAVDYVEIDGQQQLPYDYDEDTGEIELPSEVATGQSVKVCYRPLGRKRVTVAQVPVKDVAGVWVDKSKNQEVLGEKVFDAVSGKITFQNLLASGTQSLYCEYTSVDMEDVTGEETWQWMEGDRPFPLYRASDDPDLRYATLQPDPTSSRQRTNTGILGLTQGVDKIVGEIAKGVSIRNPDDEIITAPVVVEDSATGITGIFINPDTDPVLVASIIVRYSDNGNIVQKEVKDYSIISKYRDSNNTELTIIYVDSSKAGLPEGAVALMISYYSEGKNMVLVPGPLPLPSTVRVIDLNNLYQPRSDLLRINRNLLYFDPDYENWRANALSSNPLDGYNILGIFDNSALTGWNYWTPGSGKVQLDASGAAILQLNTVPHSSISRLYIKVSSYAIDGVFTETQNGHNYYPGRMADAAAGDPANDPWNDGYEYAWYNPKVEVQKYSGDNNLVGEIHLARSLPTAGQQVYVTWRELSRLSVSPARGPVMAAPTFRYLTIPGLPVSSNNPLVNGNGSLSAAPPVFSVSLNGVTVLPYGTQYLYDMGYYAGMCVSGTKTSAVYATGLGRYTYQPMYAAENDGTNFTYRAAVSAGLNLSRVHQRPSYDLNDLSNTCLLLDPRSNPVDYAPLLVADKLAPATRRFKYTAACHPDTVGGTLQVITTELVSTEVNTSGPSYGTHDTVAYGGTYEYGLDWLTNYNTHLDFPVSFAGKDPLTPALPSPIVSDSIISDNGSGSTSYEFRVRYWNLEDLPPRPWLKPWVDEYDVYYGIPRATGVVLYLDLMNALDLPVGSRHESYRPHFMYKEDSTDTNYKDGCDYVYHVTPTSTSEYISLLTGSYHYYFGCSDDSLTFEDDDESILKDTDRLLFEYQLKPENWGAYTAAYRTPTRSSTGIDPFISRTVTDKEGRPWMPRKLGRRYSAFGDDYAAVWINSAHPKLLASGPQDWQLYVDRFDRVPGLFELDFPQQYQWKSTEHPEVSVVLRGFDGDSTSGYPRFYGTLLPFYRAVNPSIETPWGASGFGAMATRMETCGATTSTTLTFRIKCYQTDNTPPLWVKVFINNESLKLFDYSTGQSLKPENGGYSGYTMQPASVQTTAGQSQKPPYNYSIGVDYELKTQLASGPHTYFFMANDGKATALYPARPGGDKWIPDILKEENDAQPGKYAGFDNNYCSGPYVNTPCQLLQPSVSPATGIQGQQYVYRVRYVDADGHRPYKAKIFIETGTDRGTISVDMLKEDPTASDYKTEGVWYVLNTATLENFAIAKGVRHYRFEFIDDWGRPTDPNDIVKGETTLYPASGSWVDGPTIGENVPPTLRYGKVESPDGTSNGATLWTFGVVYKDLNNDPPKFITLYIGELQSDGQSIKWDNGCQMTQADPSDVIYSDGCQYVYQTRLKEALNPADPQPVYYYSFEASDGVSLATWAGLDHPTPDQISESAGCLLKDPLTTTDYQTYYSSKATLVGTLQDQPTNAGILIDPVVWMYIRGDTANPVIVSREDEYVCRGTNLGSVGAKTVYRYDSVDAAYLPNITEVIGVYDNSDLTGTNYFIADDGTPGTYAIGAAIMLQKSLPYGIDWVWIKYRHTGNDYHTTYGAPSENLSTVVRTGAVDPNTAPVIHEVIGVYDTDNKDYFRALDGTCGSYDPVTGKITLGRPLPAGTSVVEIKYRMPKYTLIRWTGEFTFDQVQNEADVFVADYFFGTRHDMSIGTNILPTLSNPKLTPIVGSSGTDFVYTIEYKETEGPSGQEPSFVRVIIDGNEHRMSSTVTNTPSYRSGVIYKYTAKLESGAHNYYFATSDGVGLVTMPAANQATGKIEPFLGPWVNSSPVLENKAITPDSTGGSISTTQSVEYSVSYRDADGDLPTTVAPYAKDLGAADAVKLMTFPTPLLYVDNDSSTWNVGIVDEILEDQAQPGKYRSIRVLGHDGQSAKYTADQFAGKLLQFIGGDLDGKVYLIANNTTDVLKLMTDDIIEDGLITGTTFSIGIMKMFKDPVTQQNYSAGVTYKLNIPQLLDGTHKFHFGAASVLNPPSWVGSPWNTKTESSWVRLPDSTTKEYDGPVVAAQSPTGNHVPVLSPTTGSATVSPESGKASDVYDFIISYRDADGDPPRYHDKVMGSLRVIFSDGSYAADLTPVVPEDQNDPSFYVKDKSFTVRANGLPEGNHKFHFEASDGWNKVRWPVAAQGNDEAENDPVVVVNAKATLSEMAANPPNGDTNTTFSISVKYVDINDEGPYIDPVSGKEQVWVEFGGNSSNKIYLTRASADTDFANGVTYRGTKSGLTAGAVQTVFKTKDILGELTTVNGPTIAVSSNLSSPVLASAKVFNTAKPADINEIAAGGSTHTFRYEVKYSDPDGDMPVVVQNGSVIEGIKLYIDGVLEGVMTQRTAEEYLQNNKPDYTKTVTYWYTKQGATYSSASHSHSFYFLAKDGSSTDAHEVKSVVTSGPVILSGSITLERRVYSSSGVWVDRDPQLAERVKITGLLNESTAKPIPGSQRIRITITRPDGTGASLTVTGAAQTTSTVTKNQFSFEIETPMMNKNWTITAKWDGNTDYTTAVTSDIKVNVKGPNRVVATQDMSLPATSNPVVDMVCIPLTAVNGDPGSLFSFERARLMQIVRWDPEQRTYMWYGDTYFPTLTAGSAMWILPNSLYPAESITETDLISPVDPDDLDQKINTARQYRLLKPFGRLYDQLQDCEIVLKQGWNQIGSPYLSATKIKDAQVVYQGKTVTIDQAAANGWVRNYAWMWDPVTQQADKLIHPTRSDAYKRTIDPWRGYWIRALVSCTLILKAPSSNSATSLSVQEYGITANSSNAQSLDMPPAAPVGGGK